MRFTPIHPPETVAEAQHLVETTDLTMRAIAWETGVARTTIRDWTIRYGWRRPAPASEPDAPVRVRQAPPPSPKQVRSGFHAMIAETAVEARRLLTELRESPPPADAAEHERRARALASLARTQRQLDDLLARAEAAAASRSAKPKGAPHEPGRTLAQLRDEFVRLLARAVSSEPDRKGP